MRGIVSRRLRDIARMTAKDKPTEEVWDKKISGNRVLRYVGFRRIYKDLKKLYKRVD